MGKVKEKGIRLLPHCVKRMITDSTFEEGLDNFMHKIVFSKLFEKYYA